MRAKAETAVSKRRIPWVTIVLFVVAVALLLFSTIGGARAALIYSQDYVYEFEMQDIGITLNETSELGTKAVSTRDYLGDANWTGQGMGELLTNLLPDGEELQLGKHYKEELSVTNTGTIDEYVRVTIYRYWWDSANDRKMNALSPSLIELTLNGGNWADGLTFGNGWILDPEASTPERVVLYLNRPLDSGDTSPIFTDTLTINPAAAASMTTTREGNVITTTYQYNGVEFGIEAEADAVQTHNAEAAILSAWGRSVSIADDGSLSLN